MSPFHFQVAPLQLLPWKTRAEVDVFNLFCGGLLAVLIRASNIRTAYGKNWLIRRRRHPRMVAIPLKGIVDMLLHLEEKVIWNESKLP